uniref:NADP-dependent oxidoreductase domain-containing protein n=1 Tax=Guillardia theta TaxID=55529 RepID=A0A7S4L0L1_GUITH|mmetsp:Transcript_35148/g.109848  ORF Transcript_35148/g.109848 Transcript_35148/m.109848 type:complete len:390 (+) Transcript_35148:206-1375(+)
MFVSLMLQQMARWVAVVCLLSILPACLGYLNSQSLFSRRRRTSSNTLCMRMHDTSRRQFLQAGVLLGASPLLPLPQDAAHAVDMRWPELLAAQGSKDVGGVKLPAVGFGTYNTKQGIAMQAVEIALSQGVRHIDTAAAYGNEQDIGKAWRSSGLSRSEIFLSSKLDRQQLGKGKVREALLHSLQDLGTDYLDVFYIHSPLSSKQVILESWSELQELKEEKLVRAVGVSNFGVKQLEELRKENLPVPSINQIEVSPFNQRRQIVSWCEANGCAVMSSSWSRLSNKETGAKNWPKLKEIAKSKGITAAQTLIAWSLHRGLLCIPRSGTETEKEVIAIKENSPGGVAAIKLTDQELKQLDSLDEMLASGALGRTDGWSKEDVRGAAWDPTEA